MQKPGTHSGFCEDKRPWLLPALQLVARERHDTVTGALRVLGDRSFQVTRSELATKIDE